MADSIKSPKDLAGIGTNLGVLPDALERESVILITLGKHETTEQFYIRAIQSGIARECHHCNAVRRFDRVQCLCGGYQHSHVKRAPEQAPLSLTSPSAPEVLPPTMDELMTTEERAFKELMANAQAPARANPPEVNRVPTIQDANVGEQPVSDTLTEGTPFLNLPTDDLVPSPDLGTSDSPQPTVEETQATAPTTGTSSGAKPAKAKK